MSLVAYGSSDDSEESEIEDTTAGGTPPKVSTISKTVTGSDLAKSNSSISDDIDNISDSDSDHGRNSHPDSNSQATDETIDGMLKGLPSPKESGSGVIEETDELEDEVKPKPSQMADVPKPPARKTKQPVRITIPALPDSDDEEGPVKKKQKHAPKIGGHKSGLFSVLPPPVHAAKKESNRILIPYSLTKKSSKPPSNSSETVVKQPSSSTVSINKSIKLQTSLANYSDSDDEDDSEGPVNFFSLDSKVKSDQEQTTVGGLNFSPDSSIPESVQKVPTVALPPTVGRTSLNLPAPIKNENANSGKQTGLLAEASVIGLPAVHQDAPLTFKGGVSSHRAPASGYSSATSSGTLDGTSEIGDQNIYYNMQYNETSQYPEVSDDQTFQHDEQFQRMQGKRQRGKEEINIMDVSADDFTNPGDLMKNMTEEQTYQSHRKNKDDQPTSQQKRKHQIHYLAFQAKETEMELKNQWANNRQTKRQTQAKYGF